MAIDSAARLLTLVVSPGFFIRAPDVSLLGRFGWFTENSGKHVHPPRELRPSVRGLFDLHGNLHEWTHDWYGDYGEAVAADPLGAEGGSYRVYRGGCWYIDAALCRSAFRNSNDPTYRTIYNGLRLALSLSGVRPETAAVKGAEPSGAGTEGTPAKQRPDMP